MVRINNLFQNLFSIQTITYSTCSLPYSYYRHDDHTYDNNQYTVHIINGTIVYRRGRGPTFAVNASNNNSSLRTYSTCSFPYWRNRHHNPTYDNNHYTVLIIKVITIHIHYYIDAIVIMTISCFMIIIIILYIS